MATNTSSHVSPSRAAKKAANDRFGRFKRGIPPKSKADYAFILHMIETAKPGSGRVAVVVPHGVLFRSAGEGAIRRQLIAENLLDCVIGLPANLFFGTGILWHPAFSLQNWLDIKILL